MKAVYLLQKSNSKAPSVTLSYVRQKDIGRACCGGVQVEGEDSAIMPFFLASFPALVGLTIHQEASDLP